MIKLRRLTQLPTATLLGHITLLWLWALDNAPDGCLPNEPWIIAEASQWEGDPQEWINNLNGSGFVLTTNEEGDEWELAHFAERMARYTEKVEQNRASSRARVQAHRDRVREQGQTPRGYTRHREEVFARDGRRCVYCGGSQGLCLDHLIPVGRGGSNEPENLVCGCRACVGRKGGRLPDEAGMTFAQPATAARYTSLLAGLPGGEVVTGYQRYMVTPCNPPITLDHTTPDHTTDSARDLLVTTGNALPPQLPPVEPQWISEQAKFEAFREYEPDDSDWAWCRKNAPIVTPESWEDDRDNYQEWCDINRKKLTKDYDSPPSFWRRWQRGVMERASKQKGANGGSSRYADRRLQVGEVGATGGLPEDSRERARGTRRVANQ